MENFGTKSRCDFDENQTGSAGLPFNSPFSILHSPWLKSLCDFNHLFGAQPYLNTINQKHASLLYSNQENAPFIPQFNLLPQISEEEKAVIRAQYPDDDVAAFNAIWAAREEKQRKEK